MHYGKTIKPETFTATLLNSATVTATTNGTVLTSKFHPTRGGFDVLHLNLAKGENTLVLTVAGTRPDGTLPNAALGVKEDVDIDKLIFVVP